MHLVPENVGLMSAPWRDQQTLQVNLAAGPRYLYSSCYCNNLSLTELKLTALKQHNVVLMIVEAKTPK